MSKLGDDLYQILNTVEAGERFVLGIVGAPGAGKSTLASKLCSEMNERNASELAIVVPMDGFHFSNARLTQINLLPLKGIPATFDSKSFVKLLDEICKTKNESVFCPRFDRSIEASIPDDIEVKPHHKLVIVEGNYLLLDQSPWSEIAKYLSQSWFIDCPMEVILPRLLQRHMDGGKSEQAAKSKVESTDLPNARLIEATKMRATRVLGCPS